MWRRDNVGGLGGEHVTCHMFQFLMSFSSLFYFILRLAISQHRWTAFDDQYYVIWRVPLKKVLKAVTITLLSI